LVGLGVVEDVKRFDMLDDIEVVERVVVEVAAEFEMEIGFAAVDFALAIVETAFVLS